MTDEQRTTQEAATQAAAGDNDHARSDLAVPRVVFGMASLAFLVYVVFGTVEARIWRYGRLNFEDRTIRHVWGYFGDRLPDVPAPGLFAALFWVALAVMVLGTIAGLWLFLGTRDDDPAHDPHLHPSEHA